MALSPCCYPKTLSRLEYQKLLCWLFSNFSFFLLFLQYKATTVNFSRLLWTLQQPTLTLMAYFNRICYHEIVCDRDGQLTKDTMNIASGAKLLQVILRQSSRWVEEEWLEKFFFWLVLADLLSIPCCLYFSSQDATVFYQDNSLSPVLQGRLPAVLVPLLLVNPIGEALLLPGSTPSAEQELKLRRSVVCSLVLARLETEAINASSLNELPSKPSNPPVGSLKFFFYVSFL